MLQTGIQLGLWLTINLEQYENIKWYGEEAGVKVSCTNFKHCGVSIEETVMRLMVRTTVCKPDRPITTVVKRRDQARTGAAYEKKVNDTKFRQEIDIRRDS